MRDYLGNVHKNSHTSDKKGSRRLNNKILLIDHTSSQDLKSHYQQGQWAIKRKARAHSLSADQVISSITGPGEIIFSRRS